MGIETPGKQRCILAPSRFTNGVSASNQSTCSSYKSDQHLSEVMPFSVASNNARFSDINNFETASLWDYGSTKSSFEYPKSNASYKSAYNPSIFADEDTVSLMSNSSSRFSDNLRRLGATDRVKSNAASQKGSLLKYVFIFFLIASVSLNVFILFRVMNISLY